MAQAAKKVLVIGDDTRSFLACVRSLGRQGLEVHVAPNTLSSPALASRYIKQVHILPYYLGDGQEWLTATRALLEKERFALVLPCEERSLLPLIRHQHEFPPETRLAIPDERALDAFFDKVRTRELASRCDVPVAQAHLFHAEGPLPQTFPLVAKYRKSYSWPDLYVRTQVKIVKSANELAQWLQAHQPPDQEVFFEHLVPGVGVGVSVLCDRGEVLQAFEHQRAHEVSGSSFYRKSMPLHPERLAAVQRMVSAIQYTGLAMFEFKVDQPTGQWHLLEVNARPWGSLPLPVAWGVDFPYRLYQLLVLGQRTPSVIYPAPRYARNFMSDLWQFRMTSSELRPHPLAMAKHAAGWMGGLLRVLVNRERQDTWVWDDTGPARLEFQQLLATVKEKLQGAQARPQHVPPALPSERRPRLLFLCQGNICRSSYAEKKARQLIDGAGLNVDIDSAGMLPRNPRPAPLVAQEAARQHGIDLSTHASKHAFEPLLRQSDWIVIFDDINRQAVLERFPDLENRLVYLGDFASAPDRQILDPDGKDLDTFLQTYRRIDACLPALLKQAHQATPAHESAC